MTLNELKVQYIHYKTLLIKYNITISRTSVPNDDNDNNNNNMQWYEHVPTSIETRRRGKEPYCETNKYKLTGPSPITSQTL
jgi:hypothetical protein